MVRNVLLVTIDSVRADHLSLFGADRTETPTLERLADRGVSFDRAFATGPGTPSSFRGMLTGTLPLSYGGLGPLSSDCPRVAERLQAEGLATGGFHSNPFLSRYFNYDRGFNAFEDYQNPLTGLAPRLFPRGIEDDRSRFKKLDDVLNVTGTIKKLYELVGGKARPYVSAEVITDDTIDWLEDVDEPFFCWSHYMDVHHPCFPPEVYRRRFDVEDVTQSEVSELYSTFTSEPETLAEEDMETLLTLYDAAIAYCDDQLERIVDHLEATDRLDDTLVIVTSDHGELFGEHGQYAKPERMYDELLHVPLVVANGPEYLESAHNDLVSLLDIPPLSHAALGATVPVLYEGQVPGRDAPREYVLAEHEVKGESNVGARSSDWLYEADGILEKYRLYKIDDGTFEQVFNTEGFEPADDVDAQTLQTVVTERLDDLDIESHDVAAHVDDDVEGRLSDLGYL